MKKIKDFIFSFKIFNFFSQGSFCEKIPYYLFICFLLILPLTWFRESKAILLIHDQNLPFSINEILKGCYLWNQFNLGHSVGFLYQDIWFLFPEGLLYLLLYKLGFSTLGSECIVFVLLFSLPGVFMYHLLRQIMRFEDQSKNILEIELASVVGAALYSFNMYLVLSWHDGVIPFAYAFLPLVIKLLLDVIWCNSKKSVVWKSILLGLIISLSVSAHIGIMLGTIFLPLIIFIILFFMMAVKRKPFKEIIRLCLIAFVVALTMSVSWIVPTIYRMMTLPEAFHSVNFNTDFSFIGLAGAHGGLLSQLRLIGVWVWGQGWAGKNYYSFSEIYDCNSFLVLMTLLIPAFSIFALLGLQSFQPLPSERLEWTLKRIRVFLVFFFIVLILVCFIPLMFGKMGMAIGLANVAYVCLLIISLVQIFIFVKYKCDVKSFILLYAATLVFLFSFLANGIQPPLGKIFEWLYLNVPGFKIFRSPYSRFIPGLTFGLSVLFGFSALKFLNLFKNKNFKILIALSLISFILAYAWPLLTGSAVIEKNKGLFFDRLIKVPEFYKDAAEYLNQDQSEFRVALCPGVHFGYYKWNKTEGNSGQDLFSKLVNHPIVPIVEDPEAYWAYQNSALLLKSLYRNLDLGKLPALNVKYLVLRKDIAGYESLLESVEEKLGACFEKDPLVFGPLKIYKVKNECFIPRIYSESFQGGVSQPDIIFRKINPTRYRILVSTRDSFSLFLNESYSPDWKVYVQILDRGERVTGINSKKLCDEKIFGEQSSVLSAIKRTGKVFQVPHQIVNGYANKWDINLRGQEGPFLLEITLEFLPQRYWEMGCLFSGGILFLILTFGAFNVFKVLLRGLRRKIFI